MLLENSHLLIVAGLLCGLAVLPLFPTFMALRSAQRAAIYFANRPTLPIITLFLVVIAMRLALIGELRIPIPGIHDEFSYLLMADTFAQGRLANPTHPLWVSFETIHVNSIPTYSSVYPPAQGFVLAIGQLLGHPWLGVVLSNAAMCASITWMLRAWIPRRWALLGGVITAVQFSLATYWMNSYWGGAVAATGGALALGAMRRVARGARIRDALLLSLGIVILGNSRPWEGLIFCIPLAVYFLWWMAGKTGTKITPRLGVRRVLLPVLSSMLLAASFMAYYNYRLTGNPLLLPHVMDANIYITEPTFLWQHPRPQIHYRNSVLEAYYHGDWLRYSPSVKNIMAVFKKKIDVMGPFFFQRIEWPLILVVPFLFRDRRMKFLMTILLVGTMGLLVEVWAFPHYAAPLLCVLVALLIQAMRHMNTVEIGGRPIGAMIVRVVVVLLIVNTGRNVLEHKCDVANEWMCFGQLDRATAEAQLLATPGKHLVIVRYSDRHEPTNEWVYNRADIDSAKIVWARDMDTAQNEKLLAYFKDRQVWLARPDQYYFQLRLPTPYATAEKGPNIAK